MSPPFHLANILFPYIAGAPEPTRSCSLPLTPSPLVPSSGIMLFSISIILLPSSSSHASWSEIFMKSRYTPKNSSMSSAMLNVGLGDVGALPSSGFSCPDRLWIFFKLDYLTLEKETAKRLEVWGHGTKAILCVTFGLLFDAFERVGYLEDCQHPDQPYINGKLFSPAR
ncbi:hypothetical protein FRC12_007532 [Ceratobasidium sp. 428]|nr:hypothetical protein FRC12_007532 [Ceratobasidium sp. 428]